MYENDPMHMLVRPDDVERAEQLLGSLSSADKAIVATYVLRLIYEQHSGAPEAAAVLEALRATNLSVRLFYLCAKNTEGDVPDDVLFQMAQEILTEIHEHTCPDCLAQREGARTFRPGPAPVDRRHLN